MSEILSSHTGMMIGGEFRDFTITCDDCVAIRAGANTVDLSTATSEVAITIRKREEGDDNPRRYDDPEKRRALIDERVLERRLSDIGEQAAACIEQRLAGVCMAGCAQNVQDNPYL